MSALVQPERAAQSPRRHSPSRESLTTINTDGSRYFLYPADVSGRFTRGRTIVAWVLILVYLLLPWIPVRGFPAVFLDVAERRFHFFGYTLAAQDAWLLFFLVTGLGFTLFFVTALLGRIWCGWACPHTVFLDHVYRRIERWIDGDAISRKRLAEGPLSVRKAVKRIVKHGFYGIVSLAIAHLFLSYFVSIPELWAMMREAPGEHWASFVFVFALAGILYFNFAWFREQLCIVICPYGRLQSALIDDDSLVVGYDARRGEPRGHAKRASSESVAVAGDCIDCNRCVQVCPTGIDIRQGLQIECIGCAACIDACDEVMMRLGRPRGLVRYDSLAGLAGEMTNWVRARTVLYGVLLVLGASVAIFAFSTVKPASFSVVRLAGAAYFVDGESVRNQFLVRLLNKRSEVAFLVVSADGLPPYVRESGFEHPVAVASMAEQVSPLVLQVDRRDYAGPFTFTVRVRDAAGSFKLSREVEFLGPDPRLLREEDHEKGLIR